MNDVSNGGQGWKVYPEHCPYCGVLLAARGMLRLRMAKTAVELRQSNPVFKSGSDLPVANAIMSNKNRWVKLRPSHYH